MPESEEIVKDLSNIDKILIENLALAEENAHLKAQINEMKIMEKKMVLRNHLATKFKIDLEKLEMSVDGKNGQLRLIPKNAKA